MKGNSKVAKDAKDAKETKETKDAKEKESKITENTKETEESTGFEGKEDTEELMDSPDLSPPPERREKKEKKPKGKSDAEVHEPVPLALLTPGTRIKYKAGPHSTKGEIIEVLDTKKVVNRKTVAASATAPRIVVKNLNTMGKSVIKPGLILEIVEE